MSYPVALSFFVATFSWSIAGALGPGLTGLQYDLPAEDIAKLAAMGAGAGGAIGALTDKLTRKSK